MRVCVSCPPYRPFTRPPTHPPVNIETVVECTSADAYHFFFLSLSFSSRSCSDDIIESVAKMTIPEIFAEDGEAGFREIETSVLAEVAAYKKCVVATGGGIIKRKENWMHLRNGVVLCLSGPASLLARRVVADGAEARPLFKDEGNDVDAIAAKIAEMYEERQALYANADVQVRRRARSMGGDTPSEGLMFCFIPLLCVCVCVYEGGQTRVTIIIQARTHTHTHTHSCNCSPRAQHTDGVHRVCVCICRKRRRFLYVRVLIALATCVSRPVCDPALR
jgi:shikimate kinase